MTKKIEIYDTTLRDGSQGEGVNFSLADKLAITHLLDELGVHCIEGGWPGSNPKDVDYFKEARNLKLKNGRIAAFGSTRHAKNTPGGDPNLKKLVQAKTPIITIFGKSWDLHVREALRVSLDENRRMIESSVRYLVKRAEEVFYDAEHFFDGYIANPEYALDTLAAAAEAGASRLILCDTNGGNLPEQIAAVTRLVCEKFSGVQIGIHAHNDSGVAVANSLVAISAGARQVQGTMNGLGERVGNADLVQVIPNLELKLGISTIGKAQLKRLVEVSRYIYETANLPVHDNAPFVGRSAFAHKGGIHVSAVARNAACYEHIKPEAVGNEQRILISELSGRSNILARAKVDLKKHPEAMRTVLKQLMELENRGYAFESAEASFDLLVSKALGEYKSFFTIDTFRVMSEHRGSGNGDRLSEATVKVQVGDQLFHTVSEGGHGPVDALDQALRKALVPEYPELAELKLIDYKVHIVNAQAATEAKVRVVIESSAGGKIWGTVGVSENIIEASCQALVDSLEYLLMNTQKRKRQRGAGSRKTRRTTKTRK